MSVTTTTTPTTGIPWAGLFDAPRELDERVVDVDGRVPDGLAGTLLRVGPGDLARAEHLFDGDGFVTGVRVEPGGDVHVRSRYVRTEKRALEAGGPKSRVAGFGTRAAGGVLANALRRPGSRSNAANTALLMSAGRLLALWEGGRPWQLDPDSLDTVGELDFEGALPRGSMFSAHPHWDPRTREVFNFGMSYGPRTTLVTYRLDPSGKLSTVNRVPLPKPYMNHDFILTDRWMVFCFGPAWARVGSVLLGLEAFGDSVRWHADEPTLVVLVPRDGGPATMVEAEPWFQFHFAGAFDDGDDVVVDLVRYDDYDAIMGNLKHFRTARFDDYSSPLWRYRIDPKAKRVEGRELAPQGMEFPQVDGRRATGGYDVVYGAFRPPAGGLPTGLGRVDVGSGRLETFDFGPGRVASEPVFVPRPGGDAEDDGWLVALVHDPGRRAADAVVLDARRIGEGPVCTAHLPGGTGITFHGLWRPAG